MIPIYKLDDDGTFDDVCDLSDKIDDVLGKEVVGLAEQKFDNELERACAIGVAALGRSMVAGIRTQAKLCRVSLTDDECDAVARKIEKVIAEAMVLVQSRMNGTEN